MNTEDEQKLLLRLRAGDEAAFREVVRLYSLSIQLVLSRLLGPEQHMEELLQTVFVEAFRSIGSFEGRSKLKTWLRGIAVRVCYREIRRRSRFKNFLERFERHQLVDLGEREPFHPQLHLERQETEQLVRSVLERIGPRKRMVLLLCDMEGFTYPETAEMLDLPEGTVCSRLYHARREFRAHFERELASRGIQISEVFDHANR